MKKYTKEALLKIFDDLKEELKNNELVEFEVLNPDFVESTYAGEKVKIESQTFIYRGYKTWVDLAQKLYCKMLTPKIVDEQKVIIKFRKLKKEENFHKDKSENEKYGSDSVFSRINKLEESEFLLTYKATLENVNIEKRKRVLNLGINKADEFELIKDSIDDFSQLELVGVDFCQSAINEAKEKFINHRNVKFYTHDITKLDELDLGKFDLIISIGTFQSSNLEFNKTFMNIVQNYLKKDGSMILGFPNCSWLDGEIVYGARIKNYAYPEMSNLFKDANFCKKYLQQKKFRVTLTGKYYIFLTANSIRKELPL